MHTRSPVVQWSIWSIALITLGVIFKVSAQDAATLRARFAELFGPGKYARIVWQVEERDGCKANFQIDVGNNKIMALDTRDGVVRQLAGRKTGSHYSYPSFTWDGKRVIWTDNMKMQYQVTDFLDTTKKKTFLYGYEGDGACYRTPDGKDWVLATEAKDYGRLFRVNIDDTTEKVELFRTPTARRSGIAGSALWVTISTDGKWVAGAFPCYGQLGFVNVEAKTWTKLSSDNGCWPTIARDTTGDMLYCPAAEADYHRAVRIITRNQVELARPNLLNAGLLGNMSGANLPGTFYESLRWTPDRDYVTLYAYHGNLSTIGYPNPRIINIRTLKGAAIVDNPTTSQGGADVFFYTCPGSEFCGTNEVISRQAIPSKATITDQKGLSSNTFDMRGRFAAKPGAINIGIYIAAAGGRPANARRCMGMVLVQ